MTRVRSVLRRALCLAATASIAVSCGSDPAPSADTASAVGASVLDISAPVVGGGDDIDLSAFAGQPVALWFWAPT